LTFLVCKDTLAEILTLQMVFAPYLHRTACVVHYSALCCPGCLSRRKRNSFVYVENNLFLLSYSVKTEESTPSQPFKCTWRSVDENTGYCQP